jgi:hypothetical protein
MHSSGLLHSKCANFLPTFWDNLSVPSSAVNLLKMGLIGCSETLVRNPHYLLCSNPEECSCHLFCGRSLKSHVILSVNCELQLACKMLSPEAASTTSAETME